MKTHLKLEIGPVKGLSLQPLPAHAMGVLVEIEILTVMGVSRSLMKPGDCLKVSEFFREAFEACHAEAAR